MEEELSESNNLFTGIHYSQVLRCSTASGSGMSFSLVGPTKVNACMMMKHLNDLQEGTLFLD